MRLDWQCAPVDAVNGTVRVPGDKSISHRAIMLGALAEGTTEVSGFLEGEDCLATMRAFQAMGVEIVHHGAGRVTIHGAGLHGLRAPTAPLDVGNSGTSMRLLAGVLAGQPFDAVLVGDASLMKRPMRRVTEPLALMGAEIVTSDVGTAPLVIHGRPLHGMDYTLPVASAQLKSALLLAGLFAEGTTRITETGVSRDHSERMLRVKESDRLATMEAGLRALGVDCVAGADSMTIRGKPGTAFSGGTVESHGDHRIAMSFATAALRAAAPIVVRDCANVATSFPSFQALAQGVGMVVGDA